ncbi:hypothetical protein GUJ93_ZPchr0004g38676 [Zizania palustris]|uniref:DUF4220 domain-containing protein n=1 Tax=Zizania palustris TaxID=103762 RepID=A0A8J5S000_ZIZPA|nr:hypothetical protein GUJ93_ZPchr0004g38676 [Zizania palustris]
MSANAGWLILCSTNGDGDPENPDTRAIRELVRREKYYKSKWTVMQMELSLMYDILYTKANVIHTYVGYDIRTMAPLIVATSLLLFHFSGQGGHNKVDVPITYVLLGGALILETKSLVRSLGSSWALAFLSTTRWNWLRHVALCSGRWYRLRRAIVSLRWPATVTLGNSRKWTLTMRQYNMLCSCARQVNTTSGCFNDWSKFVGLSDWLDWMQCSWNIPIPEMVLWRLQEMLEKIFKLEEINTMGLLRGKWGDMAMSMNKENRAAYFKDKIKPYHGVDFHESVLIWHIATEMFLAEKELADDSPIVEAIRALSNYLMFLFVDRPDMLPGLPQKWLYEQTKNNIVESCKSHSGFVKESSRLKQIKQKMFMLVMTEVGEVMDGRREAVQCVLSAEACSLPMISTMGGGLNRLMGLWNQWTTQILVLLSLTLQVVLHVVAGVRRREMTRTTAVKRILLWLAYQLADTTAIYTVGHLSLSSAPREHKLVAFWAPFLLLHLGGPDSITAYALEDNKLWKRHAVTLAVQVLGVVYVLYTYIAGNGMLIVLAAALMFLVGTAKYVERDSCAVERQLQ